MNKNKIKGLKAEAEAATSSWAANRIKMVTEGTCNRETGCHFCGDNMPLYEFAPVFGTLTIRPRQLVEAVCIDNSAIAELNTAIKKSLKRRRDERST